MMEYFPGKAENKITRDPACDLLTAGFLAMILEATSPNWHEIHLLFFFTNIYKSLKNPQKSMSIYVVGQL